MLAVNGGGRDPFLIVSLVVGVCVCVVDGFVNESTAHYMAACA